MDALTVVNQLRDLAADPLNRRAIVEDQGCLPGLILFLDHPNPQVVYSALLVSMWSHKTQKVCKGKPPLLSCSVRTGFSDSLKGMFSTCV